MADEIRDSANWVYRDYATLDTPSSGAQKPVKSEIRNLFDTVETQLDLRVGAVEDIAISAVASVSWHDAVRVATTADGTLATAFDNGSTIDGIVLATGNRILIKNQAAPAANGVYVVQASGAPVRATDANTEAGLLRLGVSVELGTANAGTAWVQTSAAPITVGTTAIAFVKIQDQSAVTAEVIAARDTYATLGARLDDNKISELEERAAARAASGIYPHPLWTSSLTTQNLTDAVVVTFTKERTADGMAIHWLSGDGGYKEFIHATDIVVGGYRTRIRQVIEVVYHVESGISQVGLCFDNGVTKTFLFVNAVYSRLGMRIDDGADTLRNIDDDAPTIGPGDTIDFTVDLLHDSGYALLSVSLNGGRRYYASFAGVASSNAEVHIYQKHGTKYNHRLELEAIAPIAEPEQFPSLASPFATLLARPEPTGWAPTRALPDDFEVYHYDGRFSTSYDDYPCPVKETDQAAVVYVGNDVGASDTNEGTEAAPLASIRAAIKAARYARLALIKVAPGTYLADTSWGYSFLSNTKVAVVPWGDGRIVSSAAIGGLVWALDGGVVWKATAVPLSLTEQAVVYDHSNPDANGADQRLVERSSIVSVQDNPGSYYVDGFDVYVSTFDSREPDADIIVYDSFANKVSFTTNGGICYLENIDFIYGSISSDRGGPEYTGGSTFVTKNVTFRYRGVHISGEGLYVGINTEVFSEITDGFDYGASLNSGPMIVIELGCTSSANGSLSADQASTAHDGSTVVRVNGTYLGDGGQGITDVNAGYTWLLGCTAQGGSLTDRAFQSGGAAGDAHKMWLESCTSIDSAVAIYVHSGAAAYTYNFTANGGTVAGTTPYTP